MPASVEWTSRLVEDEKAAAKQQLDAVAPRGRARLKAAMQQVATLRDDESPLARLRCYLFSMSALVEHERSGGLRPRQVKQLVELAQAILQAERIRPRTSRMAALHGTEMTSVPLSEVEGVKTVDLAFLDVARTFFG